MKPVKRQNYFLRFFAVFLAFCFLSVTVFSNITVSAQQEVYYDDMTPEQKQDYLKSKLSEVESQLDELGDKSKDTEEYVNALDEKIKYLREQLNIVKEKVSTSEDKIVSLNRQHKKNTEEIAEIDIEIDDLNDQIDELMAEFNKNYDEYCQRLRAMYISGETSVLAFLLTSSDISQLLTRYEMISRVSKHDTQLLKSIQETGTEVKEAKSDLADKQTTLKNKQTELVNTEKQLAVTVKELESDKKDMESQETTLSEEQEEANSLLKQLTDKTKAYSEYRDQTQEDLDEINRQIAEAAEKYMTTTTTTTTEKHTTKPSGGSSDEKDTTKKTTTSSSSSKTLSLTYPVPSQTRITTSFYGYSGHTGCDFACPTGSTVVAAESGTVIVSTDLKDSNGNYRSYGRYIVIMHDKKDKNGNQVYTLYAHNSKRSVSEGTYVRKGQKIAESGSTGNSTGPHCHFEVRTPNYYDYVDPEIYLP